MFTVACRFPDDPEENPRRRAALFLNDLRTNLSSLPVVPQSIVILTGLSQAGYLTSKGVSNLGSK
jgi:hypothetical protein